jgi:hypothetical protein
LNNELQECVKDFFEYLDLREESESGKIFAPIEITCCRALLTAPLDELLNRMRILSGAPNREDV